MSKKEYFRSVELGFLAQPPQLEALALDRFFNCGAGEFMRRCPVGSHDAGHCPRTMLRREFATARVAGEGMQFPSGFGFEDVNAHGLSFVQWPRVHGHVLWAGQDTPASSGLSIHAS